VATGNYNMEGMVERAKAALAHHRAYVEEQLVHYQTRLDWRKQQGIPTLAILGMGRAGKDTTAEYLGEVTKLTYAGSSSNRLCKFVAHMTGLTEEQAFAERHQHREFWIKAGHAIRGCDLTLLARINLGWGDMAIGLRGRHELHGCKRDGVIDAAIWIEKAVPADPTVEFTAGDCDMMIPNNGSYSELYRKLDKLVELLRIPVRKME
jgi:hypothetical protein